MSTDPGLLSVVYRELDQQMESYLQSWPSACCPQDCFRCCLRAAPLVSQQEFEFLHNQLLQLQDPELVGAVRSRALLQRAALEAGGDDDFSCPLLRDGRCLVYQSRPYLCRSFGHTSRMNSLGQSVPYSCEILQQAVTTELPPTAAYRISALAERVTQGVVVDSYLPIWLSTQEEQRRVFWREENRGVVVAKPQCRVALSTTK